MVENIIMKHKKGEDWVDLNPQTTAEQVVESASKRFTSDAEMNQKASKTPATVGTDGLMSKDDKAKVDSLATVATSGNYNDLANRPTLGTAASKNTGTASGNVPILGANGKLDDAVVPNIAITDTFVVAGQAAMLALTVERGDVAVRTDLNKTFILKQEPASTLANWQELLNPQSPVQSVAGKTGVVTLVKNDVGLPNVDNTSDTNKPVSTATQTELNKKANLASPTFTGSPKAPTATKGTNTTQLATTAFVQTAISDLDTGGVQITVSTSAPTASSNGDFWYEVI